MSIGGESEEEEEGEIFKDQSTRLNSEAFEARKKAVEILYVNGYIWPIRAPNQSITHQQ